MKNNQTIYTIEGKYSGISVLRVWVNDTEITPEKSQEIRNHSPDGFNAGYGGSGVAQLALAILLHTTSEQVARWFYQDFKWDFLADPALQEDFYIRINIHRWVKKKLGEKFYPINLEILEASGIPFKFNKNETIAMFRNHGFPKIDFYLASGRWKILGNPPKMMPLGKDAKKGAEAFLEWYQKQEKPQAAF